MKEGSSEIWPYMLAEYEKLPQPVMELCHSRKENVSAASVK